MKKIKLLFAPILLATLGVSACSSSSIKPASKFNNNNLLVASVELNQLALDMELDTTYQLVPTIKYKDDKEVEVDKEWRSSKETVASVDENGVVTANANGSAYITYRAGIKLASCLVTINVNSGGSTPEPGPGPEPGPDPSDVTISLNRTSLSLSTTEDDKKTFQLEATVSDPAYTVSWRSEDSFVATVSETGLVTAVGTGSTNIYATSDGHSVKCSVVVNGGDDPNANVTVYFFLDYNNVDEADLSGNKLITKFKWYNNVPLKDAPIPADPKKAADPAFPYFIGWSSHSIIDTKADLWNFDTDVIALGRTFIYIYGIWADVPAGSF